MSKIVIAPDSFKGSATSIQVCRAIAKGWQSVRPNDELILIPLADGGEGTLLAIEQAQPAALRVYCPEISPDAYWLLLDGITAVVELAQSSGLTLLHSLDPMNAHTFAFGQVLAHAAADFRVERIFCALGGSASTDAGAGALMALGFEFFDASGISIGLGGGQLSKIKSFSKIAAFAPPHGGVTLLVDVDSPLLGPEGAANIFAPQKGATPQQVVELEEALSHFSTIVEFPDSPGSGAAGGTAFGLCAFWGATIKSGAATIAELVELDVAINGADLVITGEGRFDSQSFKGKVVQHLTERAIASHIPIAYCVGSVEDNFPASCLGGVSLAQLAGSVEEAMQDTAKYLEQAGVQLAHFI